MSELLIAIAFACAVVGVAMVVFCVLTIALEERDKEE